MLFVCGVFGFSGNKTFGFWLFLLYSRNSAYDSLIAGLKWMNSLRVFKPVVLGVGGGGVLKTFFVLIMSRLYIDSSFCSSC